MNKILKTLKAYFSDTLALELEPKQWGGRTRLPIYLKNQYDAYQAEILGLDCLFLVDLDLEEKTPATINKHIVQVKKKFTGEVIYVCDRVASYNRKRLIEHKVPFVIPGNQLYLPPLGLDLREYFKSLNKEVKTLSPAAQACVLHVLYDSHVPKGMGSTRWSAKVAEDLGYSKMTISRVFKELDSLDLATYYDNRVKGLTEENYMLNIGSGKEFWQAAQEFFKSPVKKRVYVETNNTVGISSGLSALAHYTMLAEPKNKVVAVSHAEWKSLIRNKKVNQVNVPEHGVVEVEIWSYDPELFSQKGIADRLSLYLSLKENVDERVQMALSEMMEDFKW